MVSKNVIIYCIYCYFLFFVNSITFIHTLATKKISLDFFLKIWKTGTEIIQFGLSNNKKKFHKTKIIYFLLNYLDI